MFEDNNIHLSILSFAPAIIYGLMIFTVVRKHMDVRNIFSYMVGGLLSIMMFYIISFIFPDLQNFIDKEFVGYMDYGGFTAPAYRPTIFAFFVYAFVQVGLFEEICKWISFKITDFMRWKDTIKDKPIAVMVYSCMAAVGFATYENMTYVQRTFIPSDALYGADPESMLILRSISSIIVHMVCGLFIGYFIALGREQSKKMLRPLYTIAGLAAASLLHGIYDYSIFHSTEMDYFVIGDNIYLHITNYGTLFLSLIIAFLMAKDLIRIGGTREARQL